VSVRSEVRNAFVLPDTLIVGSNPTLSIDAYIHLFCICFALSRYVLSVGLDPPTSPIECLNIQISELKSPIRVGRRRVNYVSCLKVAR
jgi:hypothetical protein